MSSNNKPISTYKFRKIILCFCLDLTAIQTSKLLGINRNTINKYFNIFRLKIYRYQTELKKKFVGEVEVDESYFGPRRIKGRSTRRGRGTHRQPVFGIYERNGRVYTEIIPNCQGRVLKAIITGKVDLKSTIYSDSWSGYRGLVAVGYDKHFRINHKKDEFSKGRGVHVNGIESFWSYTKRRLTKFNGVKKNFHLHLKECEWRWDKPSQQLESEVLKLLKC